MPNGVVVQFKSVFVDSTPLPKLEIKAVLTKISFGSPSVVEHHDAALQDVTVQAL